LALLAGCAGIYWWKEVRPFVCISGGILQVATQEIVAEDDGKISEFLEEDFFGQGQLLFSTKDPFLLTQLQQIERKVQDHRKEIEGLQGKLDQNMQQYMYLQNELEAQIGPTELTDQIFGEIQKLQNQVHRLEQEVGVLETSRIEVENKVDAQVVLAPFEGLVMQRFKQVGGRVRGGERLMLICDKERRWIETEIEEKMLSSIRPGLFARIEFPSFPGKRWDGQVSWVSPVVESGKVKIRLTADLLPLRPGLSAKTYIKVH
jgi:multidrug resistance efflux pump